jgi:hypothetical protein
MTHGRITVTVKGKRQPPQTVLAARGVPGRNHDPARHVPRAQIKPPRHYCMDPLIHCSRRALRLCKRAAGKWGNKGYKRKKAATLLRQLKIKIMRMTLKPRNRPGAEQRGTEARYEHPDRNRITEYGAGVDVSAGQRPEDRPKAVALANRRATRFRQPLRPSSQYLAMPPRSATGS